MPVYSDKAILEALENGILSIEPLHLNNIQPASIDLTLGDKVKVVCLGKDKMGRFSFSIKDVAE